MERLEEQFEGALTKIEVSGPKRDRAIKAHEEIRGVLEADPKLQEWGIKTVLVGSYARRTGIYPGKDVDVFVKLTKLTTESEHPASVYNRVRDVLRAHYGNRAKPQARSIKVDFDGDGFAVDAVPAVRMGERWGIPRRKTELWESPNVEERWVETDPEKLAGLAIERNKSPKVGVQGAYVPTVKLVRQTRRHHLDDQKPGGPLLRDPHLLGLPERSDHGRLLRGDPRADPARRCHAARDRRGDDGSCPHATVQADAGARRPRERCGKVRGTRRQG